MFFNVSFDRLNALQSQHKRLFRIFTDGNLKVKLMLQNYIDS